MSRSSPGRYSLHDFAKNVYDVHAFVADGRELRTTRPDPYGWTVPAHGDAVTVKYKVFGDRVDGTYLAIDTTHAHMNMPAAIMWARGLDDRPAMLIVRAAGGRPLAGRDAASCRARHPFEFTAPNLQYLMDSPIEFGPVRHPQFTVDGRTIPLRAASHGHRRRARCVREGRREDRPRGRRDLRRVSRVRAGFLHVPRRLPPVRQRRRDGAPQQHGHHLVIVASERPRSACSTRWRTSSSTTGTSSASGRGRSSRSISSARTCRASSGSAEGFTQYYGPLTLSRAGLADLPATLDTMGDFVQDAWRSIRRTPYEAPKR